MHNLTVDDIHTYYVLAGKTPVLVRNSTPCTPAIGPQRPTGVGDDWVARVSDNGKGSVWQKPGSTGNADMLRVMIPTGMYPNGYVRFTNKHGQSIGLNGKPGSKAATHIPMNPGCGLGLDVRQENRELNNELIEFVKNGSEETRLFTEFTSWEWDTVTVVNLEILDDAEVEVMTGEEIDVPEGQNGLFVYYLDGKRVRIEMLGVQQFCSGSYTRDAVVNRTNYCWLQDKYVLELPGK